MSWPIWHSRLVLAIAVLTLLSGLVQLSVPGLLLNILGAESTPTSRHFFAIVGMFMFLFGGALWHALLSRPVQQVVVLWTALQKVGACTAVGLGVLNAIFSPLALLVASFDLFSAVVIFWYWRVLQTAPEQATTVADRGPGLAAVERGG